MAFKQTYDSNDKTLSKEVTDNNDKKNSSNPKLWIILAR